MASFSRGEKPRKYFQKRCIKYFDFTRSYAALQAADIDWIVGLGYILGRYILDCSQRLVLCLRHSARTDILFRTFFVLFLDNIVLFLDYLVLFPYFD